MDLPVAKAELPKG